MIRDKVYSCKKTGDKCLKILYFYFIFILERFYLAELARGNGRLLGEGARRSGRAAVYVALPIPCSRLGLGHMTTAQRGFLPLWLILFLLAATVVAGGVVYVDNKSSAPPPLLIPKHTSMPSATTVSTASAAPAAAPSSTPTVIPTPAPIPPDAQTYSFPSPDNRFTLEFYHARGSDASDCAFRIKDGGRELDGSKLLGTASMDCYNAMDGFDSPFIGWADGDRLILRNTWNDIKIVNPVTSGAQDYQVTSTLFFRGTSHTLKYWLFQKDPDGPYTLLDGDGKTILANLDNKYDRGELYDPVNDGFLFMGRDYSATSVSVRLDFLSLSDLKLRSILTTEPTPFEGRGCGVESLSSKPGEIILSPGCLMFGSKYFSADGQIHIQLPPDVSPTPTPAPTIIPGASATEWGTYRNYEWQFEVKIPPNWTVDDKGGIIISGDGAAIRIDTDGVGPDGPGELTTSTRTVAGQQVEVADNTFFSLRRNNQDIPYYFFRVNGWTDTVIKILATFKSW